MFKHNNREDAFIRKIYARLLPVQIIMVAIQSINGIVDGIIGSRLLGSDAMAAVGLFSPLLSLLYALACIIIVGSQVLGSQTAGKGNMDNTNKIFSITICLIAILGVVVAFILLLFNHQLAVLMKGNEMLADYMIGVSFSFLFDVICAILADYLQLMGNVKNTYIGLFVLIASNTLLNVVFIKTLNLGILGLGLATTVSTMFTFLIMGSGFIGKKSNIHFTFSGLPWNQVKEIIIYGSSAATFNIVLAVKGFALNYIVLFIGGELALGAMSVYNSILGLTGAISMGIGTTTLTIGSVFYGEKDSKAVKSVFRVSFEIGITLAMVVAIFIVVFSGSISALFYSNEPQARKILQDILIYSTMYIPLNIIICVYNKMYHIRGKMIITNILSFLENAIVIVAALTLGLLFGLKGVWFSLPVGGLLLAVWIVLYTREKGNFNDFNSQNSIYFNVFDEDDIDKVYGKIKNFILKHKPDEKDICRFVRKIIIKEKSKYKMFNCSVLDNNGMIEIRVRNNDKSSSLDIEDENYKVETQNFIGITEFKLEVR